MQNTPAADHSKSTGDTSARLDYLDWLSVLLILGVFLYHAIHPFVLNLDWQIKNAEQSEAFMAILLTVNPWGLPLFFLVAGAGSYFALRRRNNRQYISERVNRLLIPFVIGSILLTPFQEYLGALNKETFQGSFLSFFLSSFITRVKGKKSLRSMSLGTAYGGNFSLQ